MAEGLEEIVEMVEPWSHIMRLTGDDVEIDVAQTVNKRSSVRHVTKQSVSAVCPVRVLDAEDPPAIGELDPACAQVHVVAAVTGVELELVRSASEGSIKQLNIEANPLTPEVDPGAGSLESLQRVRVPDRYSDSLKYAPRRLIDPERIV